MRVRLVSVVLVLAGTGFCWALMPERRPPQSRGLGEPVLYAELREPAAMLEGLRSEALTEWVSSLPQYRQLVQSRQYAELRAVVTYVETRLQKSWQEILEGLLGGGVSFAVFPGQPPRACLIARAKDAVLLKRSEELFRELAEQDARKKGRGSPIRPLQLRGRTIYAVGPEAYYVLQGETWLLANSREVLEALLAKADEADLTAPIASDPLAEQARDRTSILWTATQPGVSSGSARWIAWAFIRGEALRQGQGMKEFLAEKYPHAGIPVLFGGLPFLLKEAAYVSAGLWSHGSTISLILQVPRSSLIWPEKWQWAYGKEPGQEAAVPLRPKGTILTVSFYRDWKGFWDAKDELIVTEGLTGFVELENNVGRLLFGKQDFATEVIGCLDPRSRWVVCDQAFDPARGPVPQVQLPAAAVVQKIYEPDRFGPDLVGAYQSLIGLASLGLAQNNRPRLLINIERYQDVPLHVAKFQGLPQAPSKEVSPADALLYNFSPSLAIADGYAVLGSTDGVVRTVIDELRKDPEAAGATTSDNVIVELYAEPLAAVLERNREVLVHQNVVREGHSRSVAEQQVDLLMRAIRLFDVVRFRWGANPSSMYLRLDVGFRSADKGASN